MSKDYLKAYAKTPKFQAGGTMPTGDPNAAASSMPTGQPAAPAGNDIQGMLQQFAQSQDPQLAVAICNAILQEMGNMQGGQAAAAPAMEHGGRMGYNAPMFRKGGKLA